MDADHRHVVLVVEDDEPLLYSLVRFLTTRGCEAIGEVSGQAALERLRGGSAPCAIVVDAILPGLDGWGVIAALRADPALSSIPAVMISAHPEYVARALSMGVRSYLPKPVEPEAVGQAVDTYCRHSATAAKV